MSLESRTFHQSQQTMDNNPAPADSITLGQLKALVGTVPKPKVKKASLTMQQNSSRVFSNPYLISNTMMKIQLSMRSKNFTPISRCHRWQRTWRPGRASSTLLEARQFISYCPFGPGITQLYSFRMDNITCIRKKSPCRTSPWTLGTSWRRKKIYCRSSSVIRHARFRKPSRFQWIVLTNCLRNFLWDCLSWTSASLDIRKL